MNTIKPLAAAFALLVVASLIQLGCVPAREHRALDQKYEQLKVHADSLRRQNDTLSIAAREAQSLQAIQRERLDSLLADSLRSSAEIHRLQEALVNSRRDYYEMLAMEESLLDGSTREAALMLEQLQKLQKELQKREDALHEASRTLNAKRKELGRIERQQQADRRALDSMRTNIDSLSRSLASSNANVTSLTQALARKDSLSLALRAKVADALFGFRDKGLSVEMRGGRVYVSMSEKLLFSSGSYELNPEGVKALRQIIVVLEQNPEINISVEGHTDDVPMRPGGTLRDNWDLSVLRATSIARILTTGTAISGARVSAMGRSHYHPLNPAKTKAARQINRRTEIILTPKLSELVEALGGE